MSSRRYPRLFANDHAGNLVAIPLSIAPKLLPREEFVSLPQKKVNQIAEAKERLAKLNAENEGSSKHTETKGMSLKRDTSSSTNTSPSLVNSQAPSLKQVHDSSTETSPPGTIRIRSPRFWSPEEEAIVLSAIIAKQGAQSVLQKLPRRSKGAIIQRFYKIKERHEKALQEADESDCESLMNPEEDVDEVRAV